jgi:hypothetical protein
MQDLFLESFSYELQLDMHSYLHNNFILAKSGCYTCGPRPVIFLPWPTAAAAVSRACTPPPGAASAPVTAGAPTPHHSPPPPRPIPFRNGRLHSIMAHHRRRPFPSDALPPRSTSDPLKGQGARPSSPHSSLPPFPHSLSPSALHTEVLTTTALTTIA